LYHYFIWPSGLRGIPLADGTRVQMYTYARGLDSFCSGHAITGAAGKKCPTAVDEVPASESLIARIRRYGQWISSTGRSPATLPPFVCGPRCRARIGFRSWPISARLAWGVSPIFQNPLDNPSLNGDITIRA
jgi:hypothetical protein